MTNFEAVSSEFCQVFAGIKFEFSLLHCTSPTVNDIATSMVTAIFAGRLKRGIKQKLAFEVKIFLKTLITITITSPG